MKRKGLASPYLVWMVAFIVLPLALILYYALVDREGKFTLANFGEFFRRLDGEMTYLNIFWRSFYLAFISTVMCLALGYPVAYILAFSRIRRINLWLVLFLLPMWMNFLLRTYAWMALLENNGLIDQWMRAIGIQNPPTMLNTPGAVVLGMVYNFLPFMILPIYTALNKTDRHLLEASRDLGAGPVRTFRRVVLPLSMPGVISGIVMVFMPAASTFAISTLMGGGKQTLIGDLIEQQFMDARNENFGSALSIILMLFILLSMRLINGAAEAGISGQNEPRRKRRARAFAWRAKGARG